MKINPQVFRDAAELLMVGIEGYCCHAIEKVLGIYPSYAENEPHCEFLIELFKPEEYGAHGWWGWPSENENREARIFALLLAADIAEDS